MSALPLPIVDARPLFAPLHDELLALLRGLTQSHWLLPTVAGAWRVRDVAAHLLDGQLRRLSMHRDGHALAHDAPDVLTLINSLNASGVAYATRLSPRVIVNLLSVSGPALASFFATLDPSARAFFPVMWAGESESQNWMDVGREYTEHWHHQMQIRTAVSAPLTLLEDRWFLPLIHLSLRALPPLEITLHIDDLVFPFGTAATVRMTRDTAWRLLYNAPHPPPEIEGDATAAAPLLRARSVMV